MTTLSLRRVRRTYHARVTAVAGLVAALGCSDVEPTTAVPIRIPEAAIVVAVNPVAATSAIEDALDRITPALTDDRAAKPLQMALERLIEALARQDTALVTAALDRAEGVLNAYTVAVGPGSGDAAGLDAIALAFAPVHAQHDASSTARP